MSELSMDDKMTLIQFAIEKYEKEEELLEKLKNVLSEKDIQRNLDTLIGTQRVRRIGLEILQNNQSHKELQNYQIYPEHLKSILEKI